METACKEEKHVVIFNSISQLNAEVSRLEDLSDRMVGVGETKSTNDAPEPTPNLMDVMNETASRIRNITDRIEGIRAKMTEILY